MTNSEISRDYIMVANFDIKLELQEVKLYLDQDKRYYFQYFTKSL
jgi:hypothetical protein